MSPTPTIMMIAGEVSGDARGAGLVRAIRRRRPGARFFGIGGDEMRAAGVEIWHDARDMAVMGLSEVIVRYPFFRRLFNDALALARQRRPDAIILVDYPGFNLRFAAAARRLGFKIVYYICPQVWAWRPSRIPGIARAVDRLIALFPFEPEVFRGTGLRVDFAGHPLVDEARTVLQAPLADLPWSGRPRLAILPGSRPHEIRRILPSLWEAAGLIQREQPSASFILATPSKDVEAVVRQTLSGQRGGPVNSAVVSGLTRQVLRQADAAMIASGTATLEAALLGCPCAVVYRTSALTYVLARRLVRTNHIGIVNVIAGREVCPELIQRGASPAAIAAAVRPLANEGPARAAMLKGYAEVAAQLGPPGAEDRAAAIVEEEITRSSTPR